MFRRFGLKLFERALSPIQRQHHEMLTHFIEKRIHKSNLTHQIRIEHNTITIKTPDILVHEQLYLLAEKYNATYPEEEKTLEIGLQHDETYSKFGFTITITANEINDDCYQKLMEACNHLLYAGAKIIPGQTR